jgi:hypothetical protein
MATATASVKLANDMVPAILSLGVANITHSKNRQVPLQHPTKGLYLRQSLHFTYVTFISRRCSVSQTTLSKTHLSWTPSERKALSVHKVSSMEFLGRPTLRGMIMAMWPRTVVQGDSNVLF